MWAGCCSQETSGLKYHLDDTLRRWWVWNGCGLQVVKETSGQNKALRSWLVWHGCDLQVTPGLKYCQDEALRWWVWSGCSSQI